MIGAAGVPELVIADGKAARAAIVIGADPGEWERRAAADLRKYIGMMSGAAPQIVTSAPADAPAIVIGSAAAAADAVTRQALLDRTKKDALVQSDAISVRREGNRLYVAGSNDESHYFAVSWLLQQWGCRWYMPTAFGEFVPEHRRLSVGRLDFAYAPPFEIRRYWLAWNGDTTGADEFRHRNFMSEATAPGYGHALDQYTAELAPPGGTHFNVPFSAPGTAEHVAARIEADYAAGRDISLAIADGSYVNEDPGDRALGGDYDPYMLKPSLTDAMLTLYNNVARILRQKHPDSASLLGGMAYVNVTRPPLKVRTVAPNLVMWIAPIDIDPNHAMDDPRSPPRNEYREMVGRWSELMDGRLAIYDYDQGMLVWRDLPNPSHHVFARDVKIYRDQGILGVQTESRGALATTFLNLFFRGQLMWDPDADPDALLEEFYPAFYGPAAAPMRRYWGRIYEAWARTNVTEHEYPAIPAIYTPALVLALRDDLAAAEAALTRSGHRSRDREAYRERMRFTRASFDAIAAYVETVTAAARDADYEAATRAGEKAIAAQTALRTLNPLFTSPPMGGEEQSPAWLQGEVRQYASFRGLQDGSSGHLVARLPLSWMFKVETPLPADWRYRGQQGPGPASAPLLDEEASVGTGWRPVRSDLYLQGQGVLAEGGQSALGHYWYRTELNLSEADARAGAHLMFPGLFNESWLYVNGRLVGHRGYDEPWWLTDYHFSWDVDLAGHLRAGVNRIALRGFNPHHFGGMFRRPFLYRLVPNGGSGAGAMPPPSGH
ncbi:DUF4838 domain-containing protein [Sphingomonas parva]|nr:DUF4838 domain-containing protein [Sphingomonas parva]